MNKQGGFTLIELVVVIVLLGVLAATAVPKFAAVTDDARLAVAQGVYGAILSSAVIQLAANQGIAEDIVVITTNTTVDSTDAVDISVQGGAFEDIGAVTVANDCAAAADSTLSVRVGGATGQTHTGSIPNELCDPI